MILIGEMRTSIESDVENCHGQLFIGLVVHQFLHRRFNRNPDPLALLVVLIWFDDYVRDPEPERECEQTIVTGNILEYRLMDIPLQLLYSGLPAQLTSTHWHFHNTGAGVSMHVTIRR